MRSFRTGIGQGRGRIGTERAFERRVPLLCITIRLVGNTSPQAEPEFFIKARHAMSGRLLHAVWQGVIDRCRKCLPGSIRNRGDGAVDSGETRRAVVKQDTVRITPEKKHPHKAPSARTQ